MRAESPRAKHGNDVATASTHRTKRACRTFHEFLPGGKGEASRGTALAARDALRMDFADRTVTHRHSSITEHFLSATSTPQLITTVVSG